MFQPQLSLSGAEYLIQNNFSPINLGNTRLYSIIKEVTQKAYPSLESKFDKKWEDFYLPLKKPKRTISIPLSVLKYQNDFYVNFHSLGNLKISDGKESIREEYFDLFNDISKFMEFYNDPNFIESTVPYKFRTGKIKGKYVLENLMTESESEEINKDYRKNLDSSYKIYGVSLNNYLETAAICYFSSFKDAKNLTPEKMYKRWADTRHEGMLDIKDKDSLEEFADWQKNRSHVGHPFEIVYSWKEIGISLNPPSENRPFFDLRVDDDDYSAVYIQMVKEMIKNKVSFKAEQLESILNFLTGETYLRVNEPGDLGFTYTPTKEYREKYFPHIKWDELKIVKLK